MSRKELLDQAELIAELDRRYDRMIANPNEGEPWEVVRERIQRSLDLQRDPRLISGIIRRR
jgi:hypothetical protein